MWKESFGFATLYVLLSLIFKTSIPAASSCQNCLLVRAMTAKTVTTTACAPTYTDPVVQQSQQVLQPSTFSFWNAEEKKDIYFLTRAKIERHNIKTRLAGISHPSCTAVDHVNRRIAVGISLRVSLFIFALSAFSSICVKVDTDLILFTVLFRPNTKRPYLQSQIWFISLF